MSLRSALLALLSSGPMTGYDVVKQFSASVGHVWHAPDSQIYPELRRMYSEGLLSSRPVPWGSRGATKTEYSITPDGEQALRQWQNEPEGYVRERDAAHLRAAYFEWAAPGAAAAAVARPHRALPRSASTGSRADRGDRGPHESRPLRAASPSTRKISGSGSVGSRCSPTRVRWPAPNRRSRGPSAASACWRSSANSNAETAATRHPLAPAYRDTAG